MKRLGLLGIIFAALVFAPGTPVSTAQAQGKPVKLIANIIKSQASFETQAFQMFAKLADQHTNGKVIVEVHFGAELGYKAADGLRILENRSVDISETIGAFEGATVPDIMITTLPFSSPPSMSSRFSIACSGLTSMRCSRKEKPSASYLTV